jgi:trigger factor
MKKYCSFLLALALSLWATLFVGCSSGTSDTAEYLKDLKAESYVTLGEYKGLTLEIAPPYEVTAEDIELYLEFIMGSYPMNVATDGPSRAGDEVVIDFEGKLDGVAFESGSATDLAYTLGSYQFIPDLDAGMVGMSVGETKDIDVTFPDPYTNNPDLAGQLTVFTVTMKSISRSEYVSALSDEYVDFLTGGEMTNVAEFRALLTEELIMEAETNFEYSKSSGIAELVLAAAEFKPLPEGFVNRIATSYSGNLEYYAYYSGTDLASYMIGNGMMQQGEDTTKVIRSIAEDNARRLLAYQVIANIEGLNVSDEELESTIAGLAAENFMTAEAYKEGLDVEGYREFLMTEKVGKFLEENATITTTEVIID